MSGRRLALAAVVALAVGAGGPAQARRDRALSGDALRAARLLGEAQVAAARPVIAALVARAPDEPEVRWLTAELAMLDGDYPRAVASLVGVPDDAVDGEVGATRALAQRSAELTASFVRVPSPSGRFVVAHAPGPDATIAALAGEVLDAAAAAIGADLGYTPPGPIRVELLGSPADLARLSTLTEAEIETTGTIALSKYGKLMVVSPRATLVGYPWMDTLAHSTCTWWWRARPRAGAGVAAGGARALRATAVARGALRRRRRVAHAG
ncbi:MAG: hypothetical protein R2939_04875 [Kofleriaceae bacterium]